MNDKGKEDSSGHTIETYEQYIAGVDDVDLDCKEEKPVNQEPPEKISKTVVAPHKKSKNVKSNEQALGDLLTRPSDSTRCWKLSKKEKKGKRSFAKKNQRKIENMSFV